MRRSRSQDRIPTRELLVGIAFAACLAVALGVLLAPAGNGKLYAAGEPGATSASVPSSLLFKAGEQEQPGRSWIPGQPSLAQSGVPVWARRASWNAQTSTRSLQRLLIDLAPLYRRPPPSFST